MCGRCAKTANFKPKKKKRLSSANPFHDHKMEYCPVHGFREEHLTDCNSGAEPTYRMDAVVILNSESRRHADDQEAPDSRRSSIATDGADDKIEKKIHDSVEYTS